MKTGVAYCLRCLEARHEGKSRLIVCTAISEQHAANRELKRERNAAAIYLFVS